MAAAAVGDGDDVKPAFRWLDVARYAAAAVMTVLIVTVIANAIKVVLRPDSLYFIVLGGSVSTATNATATSIALDLQLRGQNPSGRVRMYYTGVTAYFFDNTTSAWTNDPIGDCLTYWPLQEGIVVAQQQTADTSVHAVVTNATLPGRLFDVLYKGGSIDDVTMRLNGTLITELRFIRSYPTTYYCGPLLIGGGPGDEAFKNRKDLICKEVQHGHIVQ